MVTKNKKTLEPVHPGEVLSEEYLKPLQISQSKLALSMRVPPQRVNEIINGKRGITADSALRLSSVIGTSPEFWMSLQSSFDLEVELKERGDQIARETLPIQAVVGN